MSEPQQPQQPRQLTPLEHAICAIPFLLVIIGGAIGGACGGGAWALNQQIMRSERPAAMRYLLIALSSAGAVVAWLAVVTVLAMLFPDLFGRR